MIGHSHEPDGLPSQEHDEKYENIQNNIVPKFHGGPYGISNDFISSEQQRLRLNRLGSGSVITAPFFRDATVMSETGALFILFACLAVTVVLILILAFYCLLHCWSHKSSRSASDRCPEANTENTECESKTNRSSVYKYTNGVKVFGSTLNAAEGYLVRRYSDISSLNGKLPQIRISFSTSGRSTPDERVNSRMSNCSVIPTWMEKRSSICTTPQTPGSPASLSSGFREPLLGEKNHVTSFWHRLSGKSSASSDNISAHMLRLNMESNGHMDDHEIDKRSVLRYELSYEKTQSNCFCGNITFQLRYDFIHRVLMLHVIRANHLPTTDKNGAPDPYIKMYCLPERRNHCKTRIYKKSTDPEFNEMFSFDVPYSNLSSRMLQFTVYDFDRFTRHGLIGNIIMRDLFDKSDLYNWTEYTMQIVGSQEKNDYGDLLLYLAYSVLDKKLYITVAKAYNLRPMDITGASDPYVKISQIYQHKKVKCKRTSMKRANLNPVYHEILEFDLPPGQVDETNMLVEVMDWDRIGSDDLLGCCILGNESPTKEGRQQWEQVFSSIRCVSSMSEGYQNGTPATGRKASEGHRDSNFSDTMMPKAVGTWHSILEEVPEEYRNIPKAKK